MFTKFITITFLFINIGSVLSNPDGLLSSPFNHFGSLSGSLPHATGSLQQSATGSLQQSATGSLQQSASGLIQPGSIPQFGGGVTATTVHGSGIIKHVAHIAGSKAAGSAAPAILKAVDQSCTRAQCYDKLVSTISSNMEGIILSETNNQASYLNSFVTTKFSSYAGPLIAVALKSPEIISNIQSNNNIAVSGIVVGAVAKYNVALQSFASCSAWTVAYLGPYSIIPGFGCSIISTTIVDNQFNHIQNFMYGVPKKFVPDYEQWGMR